MVMDAARFRAILMLDNAVRPWGCVPKAGDLCRTVQVYIGEKRWRKVHPLRLRAGA